MADRERFRAILNSGEYSDMSIYCHGTWFKVHKAIVFAQCPSLSKPVGAGMGVIEIEAFTPEIVQQMIEFLYTFDYTVPKKVLSSEYQVEILELRYPSNLDDDVNRAECVLLDNHVQVNQLAHYYRLGALQDRTTEKIKEILSKGEAKAAWIQAAEKVVPSLDSKLREAFSTAIADNMETLIEAGSLGRLTGSSFSELLLKRVVERLVERKGRVDKVERENKLKDEEVWRLERARNNLCEAMKAMETAEKCRYSDCASTLGGFLVSGHFLTVRWLMMFAAVDAKISRSSSGN